MKPQSLHFDWDSFTTALGTHPPITSPGIVWLYVDHVHGLKGGMPTLIFRVWYHSPAGMVAYIGDKMTGPQTIWSVAMFALIRAGHWATGAGVMLQWHGAWSDDWDEVQP